VENVRSLFFNGNSEKLFSAGWEGAEQGVLEIEDREVERVLYAEGGGSGGQVWLDGFRPGSQRPR
jgi:hypothetical protein